MRPRDVPFPSAPGWQGDEACASSFGRSGRLHHRQGREAPCQEVSGPEDMSVDYLDTLDRSPFLLTDGATGTCLHYESSVPLDPEIGPTRLVRDERGRAALEAIYRRY